MARVTTPPVEQARSIFTDLGYTVSDDETPIADGVGSDDAARDRSRTGEFPDRGIEFRATREWKEVRVTAVAEATDAPRTGTLRCFVTWQEHAPALRRQLKRAEPEYEWAVLGVAEDGEYEVARAPPGARRASA